MEIQTNGHLFVKSHLKSGQKRPDFEWSGFQMVETIAIAKARPFENWTIRIPTFKKFGFQMFPDFRSPLVFFGIGIVGNFFLIAESQNSGHLNSKLVRYSDHGDLFDLRMVYYSDANTLVFWYSDHHLANKLVSRPTFEYQSSIQPPGTMAPGI